MPVLQPFLRMPGISSTTTFTIPSAAMRDAFFSAFACPFFLKYSTAASISPFVSPNAFLQSIMPAPVISRSSFTIPAVIAILFSSKIRVCVFRPYLRFCCFLIVCGFCFHYFLCFTLFCFYYSVCHLRNNQFDRTDCVVVAWNYKIQFFRVTVCICDTD